MADNSNIKGLLTRKEVEEILKISRSQIYNLLHQGKLPAYKIGGRLRFRREDLEGLVEQHSYRPKEVLGNKEKTVPSDSFQEALRYAENLDFHINDEEKKYKIGELLTLDYNDFDYQNSHITTARLKQYVGTALENHFSLKLEEIDEILNQIKPKCKDFARRIFIQNMRRLR